MMVIGQAITNVMAPKLFSMKERWWHTLTRCTCIMYIGVKSIIQTCLLYNEALEDVFFMVLSKNGKLGAEVIEQV